jgi:hypothetical protein
MYEQCLPLPFCAHCSNKTSSEKCVLQEFYRARYRVGEVGILEPLKSIIEDIEKACKKYSDRGSRLVRA